MHDPSDAQLLRAYAEHGAEAAFAEIVARHTDLVYSAALRQVNSSDLARDVTQGVFTDLARKARKVSATMYAEASLVGWLYRSTRFAARDVKRTEIRRTQREKQAMEQLYPAPETPPDWEHLRPALDDAMSELDDTDRDAVLLRYFKNHDLRTVGATLGISDDAAQKRVSRAVERLRELFAKRGVTIGTNGLIVIISANAVQTAPAGLALTISTTAALAGTSLATTATVSATKAITMTTLQKTIVTATIAILAGVGIYEARQASTLRTRVQMLQQQQPTPLAELDSLRLENQQLAKIKVDAEELDRLRGERNELLRLRSEVGQLRRQAAERDQPQTAGDPRGATLLKTPTTEAEFQQAQRQISTALFRVGTALSQFLQKNPYGVLVDTNGQPNPEIFANFPGLPLDNLAIQVGDLQSLGRILDEKSRDIIAVTKTPLFYNGYYTRHYLLGDGTVRGDFSYSSDRQSFTFVYPSEEELAAITERWTEDRHLYDDISAVRATLESVTKAFLAANNGQGPNDLSQLEPYATTPEQNAALQKLLRFKQLEDVWARSQ